MLAGKWDEIRALFLKHLGLIHIGIVFLRLHRRRHRARRRTVVQKPRSPQFLDFGYEQQASIVEEFVCCRALDPQAARTKRLHGLISQVMPVAPLPQSRPHNVRLPWDGVELGGICA